MKALVFILVLGNLLFYAFSAGYFGHPDNPDSGRVDQQVAADRMRLVSRGEAPPAKVVEARPAATAPAEPPPPAPAEPTEAPKTVAPSPATSEKICLRWEQLNPTEARQLSARMSEKFAAFKQIKYAQANEANTWWVFIPPLPGKPEAEKKAGELRQFGISDYFIVQEEGPNRFAISLGIFSSEKGAQDRLADLKTQGVKSARLAPRPGKDSPITLEASGPLSEKAALLKMTRSTLPKNPAQDCK